MHISFASHHCMGDAESFEKISLTGELATCGMEDANSNNSLPGTYLKDHCCDNEVSVLTVDNNYSASSFEFKVSSPVVLQVFLIPESIPTHILYSINGKRTDVSPPGDLLLNEVELPKICVFRI